MTSPAGNIRRSSVLCRAASFTLISPVYTLNFLSGIAARSENEEL
jgi:hypothetical protein